MSIIEQAAKRLEQLERAGVTVPWSSARAGKVGEAAQAATLQESAKQALAPRSAGAAAPSAVSDLGIARSGQLAARADIPPSARPEPATKVSIDLEMLRAAGYLVPDQVRSEMAEQFRHLKRPLLKNARAGNEASAFRESLIMVTSALPGEGKTFCSINLAMSMAMEVDKAVVLVDADVIRPSIFTRLGIDAKLPGLLDLLRRDDVRLQDALVATNVPGLSLMSAGERSERSTELFASAPMDRLLNLLASEYADHVVIFDAPPILLTTESPVLASKMGQVVVVVEASRTERGAVQQAFAALRSCPVVMSVLNKCDAPGDGRRYGYYYE
ncbi:MAG: XrtA-associated tyrosine autokinase [Burkholderiaceae bacterium]